jgi:tRNA A-37 threonylcarbamoyl transferase component Bud32
MSATTAPLGFERYRRGTRCLVVDAAFADAVRRLGLLEPGVLEDLIQRGSRAGGRSRNSVLPLPGRTERLHLRPFHHGGLLGELWGDRLLGLGRPLSELRVSARLRAAGVPLARPLLVAGHRRAGLLSRAVVGSLHEEAAIDGAAFLAAQPDAARLLRAARVTGAAVRCLHEAGGRHPDLHVGNILLREHAGGTDALLVDFDRARVGERPGPRARMMEIMRLYRSLLKRGLLETAGAAGCRAFLAGYDGGDRTLRRALLRHLPRERRRIAVHRWGYGR